MYHTVNWMSEALQILDEERNKTANRADILDYLAYSISLVRVPKLTGDRTSCCEISSC